MQLSKFISVLLFLSSREWVAISHTHYIAAIIIIILHVGETTLLYVMEGNNVSFQIPDDRTALQFIWANAMEECLCPPSERINGCYTNTLPRASYSEDAVHFTNLTVQANNTKVYLIYSRIMPDLREIYKTYQVIIILGKCIMYTLIRIPSSGGWGGGVNHINLGFSPKVPWFLPQFLLWLL